MSQIIQNAKQQYNDSNGVPLAGGSISYYQPGTLTPQNTWQDSALTIANPNPITLDSAGECVAWGTDSTTYRQIVKDSLGNTIWDQLTRINGFSSPISAQGDIIIGGLSGVASNLGIGSSRQVPISNGTTLAYGQLTPADIGADVAGAAAGITGIGGLAVLSLAGYTPGTNVGLITVSTSAPSGTPANGQLWFQHA